MEKVYFIERTGGILWFRRDYELRSFCENAVGQRHIIDKNYREKISTDIETCMESAVMMREIADDIRRSQAQDES